METPGRHVLLLLDNCSAHGGNAILRELPNGSVHFLLTRTTIRSIPCDGCVIACVKAIYKGQLLMRVLDIIDQEFSPIYRLDVMTGLT